MKNMQLNTNIPKTEFLWRTCVANAGIKEMCFNYGIKPSTRKTPPWLFIACPVVNMRKLSFKTIFIPKMVIYANTVRG